MTLMMQMYYSNAFKMRSTNTNPASRSATAKAQHSRTTNATAESSTGKLSLTISAKLDGVGAVCQPWTATGKQSGLQTRVAATESVSLCERMKADRVC
jgi:hypothetical protein